jgi:Spy/CpxP family protein refolding chaperone
MARNIVRAAMVLLVVAGGTVRPAGAAELCTQQRSGAPRATQDPPPPPGRPQPRKWWVDDRAEIGINDQQAASIEQIWQSSLPKLHTQREQVDQLESVLSQMILDGADETAVSAQIDKVEAARSEFNKSRTLMLYRMNRQLTPEQRTRLKAIRDRNDASHRK